MLKTTFIIIFFVLISLQASAQKKPDEKEVDAKTYELYTKAKWDELINEGDKAIDAGIDFYFLRMRMGIAYYTLENYMSATKHFERALGFSPKDTTALEYLYWGLNFSGREKEARSLTSDMPQNLIAKTGAKPDRLFDGTYVESSGTFNSDYNTQKTTGFGAPPIYYGEQRFDKSAFYFSLNLIHNPLKRLTIFQGYNYINISKSAIFISNNTAPVEFKESSKQNEYYLNAGYYAGGGFTISGIFHYLSLKSTYVYPSFDLSNNITYSKYSNTLNNYVALLSVEKSFNHFKFILGTSYSNLNYARQIQNGLTIAYFPFGNLNLYSVTDLILHSEKKDEEIELTFVHSKEVYNSRGFVKQKIGLKVTDKLWFEGFYFFGNGINFHEDNAFVVFNTPNTIKNRFGFNLISPLSPNIELSLRYEHYNQEITAFVYNTPAAYQYIINNNSINKILGGIKWTF